MVERLKLFQERVKTHHLKTYLKLLKIKSDRSQTLVGERAITCINPLNNTMPETFNKNSLLDVDIMLLSNNTILLDEQYSRNVFPVEYLPSLPKHLARYLDKPFNHEKSIELDKWLWHCQEEFEGVRS